MLLHDMTNNELIQYITRLKEQIDNLKLEIHRLKRKTKR
jgi:hypothetical protein